MNSNKDSDLIGCVKKCPFIYDKNHSEYENYQQRQQFWKETSKLLNTTDKDCRQRYKLLCRKYFLALKQLENMEQVPTNFKLLLQNMSFLHNFQISTIDNSIENREDTNKQYIVYDNEETQFLDCNNTETMSNLQKLPTDILDWLSGMIKCGEVFYGENNKIYFFCSICSMVITDSNLFSKHILNHMTSIISTDINIVNNKNLIKNTDQDIKNINPIKCNECDDLFLCVGLKEHHEDNVHQIILPYQCNWCPAAFKSSKEIDLHEKLHSLSELSNSDCNLICCTNCHQLLKSQYELDVHLANENSKKSMENIAKNKTNYNPLENIECKLCFNKFTRSNCYQHIRDVHSHLLLDRQDNNNENLDKSKIKCTVCNKKYLPHFLFEHFNFSHNFENKKNIKMECPKCGYQINPRLFSRHYRNEHDTNLKRPNGQCEMYFNVICKICNKKMILQYYYKHMNELHNPKRKLSTVKCNQCDAMIRIRYMRRHIRENHDPNYERRQFECFICKLSMKNLSNLRKHMLRRHSDDKRRQKCTICNKQFRRYGLQRHINYVHIKEKLFLCSYCGANFPLRSKLNRHIDNKHKNIPILKRFKCTTCSKSFRTSYLLQCHQTSHSDVRPFICIVCGKGFKDALTLKTHKYLHTDEKQYACKYCGKCFAQNAGKRIHERRTHENILFIE